MDSLPQQQNDKELLEKAAKAARLQGLVWRSGSCCFYYDDEETGREEWNPLDDDGQALRLAVRTCICVVIDSHMRWCGVYLSCERGKYDLIEKFDIDPSAAVRRAIVRGAAALAE